MQPGDRWTRARTAQETSTFFVAEEGGDHMDLLPVAAVLVFVVLDVVTGVVKAFATTGFDSSVMREGFFHKLGELLSVTLCVAVDAFLPRMGVSVNIDFSALCCVYLVMMEIGSILENLGAVNPQLGAVLSKLFSKLKEDEIDETK